MKIAVQTLKPSLRGLAAGLMSLAACAPALAAKPPVSTAPVATLPGLFDYWVACALFCIGLYVVLASRDLIKKLLGLGLFQAAVFLLYITMGKVQGGTAPILDKAYAAYSNPLPHVLILTAIVVGVATTALGLALAVRIHRAYGTLDEDAIRELDQNDNE